MSINGVTTRILHALVAVVAIVLLESGTFQARAELQFDVFPGYDGHAKEGDWFPITFEVRHDGPSFSGFIEVSTEHFAQANVRRIPVDLPSGTLKRISVPVFAGNRYSTWTVRLVNERGKVIERKELNWKDLKFRSSATVLLGALCRTSAGLPGFPKAKVRSTELQPEVVRLQPVIFPDNPIALEGLDALYLSSERALELKDPQIKAILAWVQSGGHLIVGVDQMGDVNGTPWLRGMLPCRLTGTKSVSTQGAFLGWLQGEGLKRKDGSDVESRQSSNEKNENLPTPENLYKAAGTNLVADPDFESAQLQVAVAEVNSGAAVLARSGGVPLAVQSLYGRGKVTVLTFSPERAPFNSWKNRDWLWASLAEVPVNFYESSDFYDWGYSPDAVFASMIESEQIRKLPLLGLIVLLLVYLVVIGPVDQIVLRRMNKQMLTWVTFPCYVILFSALIYVIGFKLRAGESEYNELHLVDILPNENNAILRGRTYAAIYSPSNDRYLLESEQFIAALRGEYLSNWGSGNESSGAQVTYIGNRFAAEVYVPVWTSQMYVNDWWQPVSGVPLSVSISRDNPLHITVMNHLDRKLQQVRVCVNAKVYELGELAPLAQQDFSLETFFPMPLSEFVYQEKIKFLEAAQWRRQTFGSENRRVKWDMARAASAACFITEMNDHGSNSSKRFVGCDGLDLSRYAKDGSMILLAWDEGNTLTTPLNRFSTKRGGQNSLLRLVIPPAGSSIKGPISQ